MKIRTKLIGLLSALLLLVILASTLGGGYMLRSRVEGSVREDAHATALDIANSLEDYLQTERSDEEVAERLEVMRRRHPLVVKLALSFATETGDTVELVLPPAGDVEVSHPVRTRRGRGERAHQYDIRRVLLDHGDEARPPLLRSVEPLWRLPERGSSSRWSRLVPQPRRSRDIRTREDPEACRPQRCLTLTTPLDPVGPQRGTLDVTVLRDRYNKVLSAQLHISALTTLAALLILLLATAWIVDRVVARPVSELERAMHEVEQGNLRCRVRTTRQDEIGNLGRGFNAMLDRLAQADEEIRGLNSRLADEVAAATQDLQRKNEALDHLNQLLLQTQRELGDKERLAALGQLAAQLAHEIGTPLASVSGHLQLAAATDNLPPQLRERLQVAIGELGRVSNIIRDYLDQTRTARPALVPVDLRRIAEEAVQVATTASQRPEVRVVTSIDPQAAEIRTDPGLVRQILINLLTNALDASHARGGSEGVVTLSADSAGDGWVRISVRDNGIGIAAEDLPRVFEPFYTTKGRGRGTGLGLSICRELARALGGRITVTSTPGQGSEFAVVLPCGRNGAGAASSQPGC
ncbi:MAG: ATP-binding protein [Myxococcales bacterium]|nr:ATP-binding protein [Myxococcota bacterium]MDW8281428.1 ATP-binding protein [Myxococcales bacterium]